MIRFTRRAVSRELASLYRNLNVRTFFEENRRKPSSLPTWGMSTSAPEEPCREHCILTTRDASPAASGGTRQEHPFVSDRDASQSAPQDPEEPRP